jgi:putative oxidoreductase
MSRLTDWGLLVGRVALVALYLASAFGKFAALGDTAALLTSKGFPFPVPLALFSATAELVGATCVVLGFYSRAAAIGLIIYSIMATVTFHNFWMLEGAARQGQFIHFMKNVGLVGAFVLLASAGSGAFSLDALRKSSSVKTSAGVA